MLSCWPARTHKDFLSLSLFPFCASYCGEPSSLAFVSGGALLCQTGQDPNSREGPAAFPPSAAGQLLEASPLALKEIEFWID